MFTRGKTCSSIKNIFYVTQYTVRLNNGETAVTAFEKFPRIWPWSVSQSKVISSFSASSALSNLLKSTYKPHNLWHNSAREIKMASPSKSAGKTSIVGVNEFQKYVCSVIPPLDFSSHKGQSGRIGVVGGSSTFTGAPYYAAIASLRLGADLVYVFTTSDAAPVIKGYSPELMVMPILDKSDAVQKVVDTLPKLHTIIIGPGLGTEEETGNKVMEIISKARERDIPILIDADGIRLIHDRLDLIKGYRKAVLTPNKPEFKLLYQSAMNVENMEPSFEAVEALANKLGNLTILAKGEQDIISDGVSLVVSEESGSPRRCGGQGDILVGLLGTFAYWARLASDNNNLCKTCPLSPAIVACLGASMVTRRSFRMAFKRLRRSMLTSDIIEEIRDSFATLFPVD